MEKPVDDEENGVSRSGQAVTGPGGVAVTARDVLLGRGNLVNNSAGNQMFRGLVRENAGEYVRCESRAQKELIARRILSQVGQYGGRFMRQVDGEGILPLWEVVSDDVALSKVRQALRDMAQQPAQSPDIADMAPEVQPPINQDFPSVTAVAVSAASAAAARSDEDDDIVQSLLQQVYLCRQAAVEQNVRLRGLLAELEQTAAAVADLSTAASSSSALSFGSAAMAMGGLASRDDTATMNDFYYAQALQESEFREQLAQLRRRGADLSGGLMVGDYGAGRLAGDAAQRHRAGLFQQRQDEEAALRQYQQLRLLESQTRFAPFAHVPLSEHTIDMDRSLLSLGLDHRISDATPLDLMLRGAYNDPLSVTSLMTPAARHDSQLLARSRDNSNLYNDLMAQSTAVDQEYKESYDDDHDHDDEETTESAVVDNGVPRGRMKKGDSADSSTS